MCLPHKCEDLSAEPQNLHQAGHGTHVYNPSIPRWEVETGESLETHRSVKMVYASVNSKHCLKVQGHFRLSFDSLIVMGTLWNACVCTCILSHKHLHIVHTQKRVVLNWVSYEGIPRRTVPTWAKASEAMVIASPCPKPSGEASRHTDSV